MNRDDLLERYKKMFQMDKDGFSSQAIGEVFHISGARVRFILSNEISSRRYNKLKENPEYNTNTRRKYRDEIISILGGKCVKCGYDKNPALQIDHVNGGGSKQRKEEGGKIYSVIWEEIQNGSKEYQILCANCNWIKRIDNRENRRSNR